MESLPESSKTPIESLYRKCIESFGNLTQLLGPDSSDHILSACIPLSTVEDELGRFRVWAEDVGAHQTGQVSSDYRLREAPEIHGLVSELLRDLAQKLQEAAFIISKERMTSISEQSDSKSSKALPENILPSSKAQHDEDVKTDLACLAMDITEIVTGLLKLSVAILQPTFRNRTQKLAAIDVSQFESVDIQDMFPKAPMYLVRRLDRANTKRRQILTYCQKSHEKARKCINVDVTALPAPILEQHEEPRTIDQPVDIFSFHIQKDTRAAKTTVSIDRQPTPDIPEATSDTSQSETSSTASVDSSRHKFRVPLLSSSELAFKRHQFECPYCFRIIVVHDKDSWRKHTFNDLQPYVCTFENCPEPDRMFSSRTEWFEHELKLHRNEWICNACNATFATAASLKAHLEDDNADLLADAPVSAIVDWCQRAITTDQLCPLCKKSYPLKSLQNHLAKHLRKVALFSLPLLIDANPENMESTDPQRPVSDNESLENFGDPKLSEPTFVLTSSQRSVEMVTGEETKASGDDLAPPSQRSVDTKLDVEIKLPGDDNDMTTPYSTGLTFQPTIITASKTPDLLFEARNSIHNSTEMVNDPTRRFITESKLKEVVNNQLLTELFERCEWAQGVDVGEILRHYLKVVSILIWIGWNNWNHFDEFFLPLTRGVVDKDRSDDALPFDWDDTSDSFLNDHYFSMRFNKEQFMFLPIVITEGEIVECREHSRLPFLEAKTLLGRGAFGVVTKELVAPGHFKYERSGNRNLREQAIAVKRIPESRSYEQAIAVKRIPESRSYEGEFINLKMLRQCLTEHKRLMVHLGGVTIGRKFYLFYDAADMDLQKFLTGHYKLFEHESFRSQCLDVITQACGLASGLKHLHKFSLDNRKVACYHRDLKPDNILIRDWHPTDSPVGTWMISDFGLSTIRKVGENAEVGDDEEDTEVGKGLPLSVAAVVHRQSRAVTAKREGSAFGPPELKLSRRSDVWSFGCILTVVLTYIQGGIDLVEEFDCRRSIGDDGRECDDYFYRRKSDNTYVRSPQVDDWLVRLGTGDSPWVSRCTDLISKTLEIEVTKRPTAKEVYKELIRVVGIVKDVRKAWYNTSPLPTTPLGISIPVFEVTDPESKPSPDSLTQPMHQDSLETREESDNFSSESSITSRFIHRSSVPANNLGPIVATWNPTSMTSAIPRTIPSFPVLDPSYVYSSAEAVDLAELARSDGTGLSQQLASETFEKNSGRGPHRASAFSTVGPLLSQRTPDPRRTATASPRKALRFLPTRKRPDPPAPLPSLPQSGEVASSTTSAIPSRYLTFSTDHEHIITTAFCSSGKLVVYVSEKTVWVYSTSPPEEQWTLKKDLKHPYDSCHLKLTAPPNVVWKAAVLAPRYICLQAAVKSSASSRTFLYMSDIESLHNSPTKLPLPLDLPPTMSQMKLSHKGMIVLNFPSLSRLRVGSCGSNCQRLEDLSEILFAKNTTVYDTSFSPDGDVLAAISQGIGEPVVWRTWRLLEGKWELFKSGSFSNTPIRHTPTFIPFSLLPGMLILEDGEMMLLGKGPDQRDSINHIGNLTNVVRIVLSHQNQDPKLLAITNPTVWRKPGEVWRTTVADNRTRIPPTKVATVHESLTAETAVVLPPDESVIMISHKSSFIERVHFQS